MCIKLLRIGWYFNCFACGEKGDVIGYYMRTRQVGFQAALHALAGDRADLTVTTPTKRRAPPLLLACDGKGCGATEEVETEDVVYLGETRLPSWWVGFHRAYCGQCVRERMGLSS